jgi:hypothetical protein
MIFKTLNAIEEMEFRNWARNNYIKDSPVNELWHPVVRDECNRINKGKTDFIYYVKFSSGAWQNETGILESKAGEFYNIRPDKNKSILLALKEEEFEIV